MENESSSKRQRRHVAGRAAAEAAQQLQRQRCLAPYPFPLSMPFQVNAGKCFSVFCFSCAKI